VERAVTTTLSAETFAKLSAAAGPILKSIDLMSMLASAQPMASVGDQYANAKISITRLALGNPSVTLTPADGGLKITAQLGALDVGARVSYGGLFVPDGSTSVGVTADQVTIAGTLVLTPAGTGGFTAKLASPTVRTTNMKLSASGLVGQILDLVDGALGSTIERLATSSAEGALGPMLNEAFGALIGPKYIDVHGKKVELLATPSEITFSNAGALVTLNVGAKIMGTESSPGYIFTPNGMPALDVSRGVQLALADDLLNQMFAQVHALGLLNYRLQEDFGIFDAVDFKATMPPMISANTGDGKLRLVLGDMTATFSDNGKTVIGAALNASVDVEVQRGTSADQIALAFGRLDVFVNAIDGGDEYEELFAAASTGIGVQLESLSDFLVTVPVPSVAGLTLDNLALRGDSGYAIVSGQIH
jgi:hypothetical protein